MEEVVTVGSDEMVQYARRKDSRYKLAICMRLLGFAASHGLSVELFVVIGAAILYGCDILWGLWGLLTIASGWQFEVSVWVQRTQALLVCLPHLLEQLLGVRVLSKWCEDFGGKMLLYLHGREHLRAVCAGLVLGTSYVVSDMGVASECGSDELGVERVARQGLA